ncbi:MAG: deoxyribose-phosphate aldolase [Mogibacterium sp.]|nr:deoxyribose-phosphate aldolase [Mogibacterium sp.]
MDVKKILSYVDHTLLAPTATWDEIKAVIDDGIKYETATVCIPPSYVAQAKDYAGSKVRICAVIGFPHGYNTTAVKAFETSDALDNGADEIDMVINLGWVKDKKWDALENEIRTLKEICGDNILKVIIETSMLTEEEKRKMCQIVTHAGADFIKTSTGFGGGGATFEDVELMVKNVGAHVWVKASGGISGLEDAEKYVEIGARRLGTSRIVKAVKGLESEEGRY